LPEAVDEQDVECGIMLTQSSQETQADTDAEEPSFVASSEIVYAVEPICGSVSVVMVLPIRASFQVWILNQLVLDLP
jgi:hypothetical protein